jgi:hypothetical protein
MHKAVVTNIIIGCALISLGLIPGLIAGIREDIENFSAAIRGSQEIPPYPRRSAYDQHLPGQIWFAVAGVALIAVNLVVFLIR